MTSARWLRSVVVVGSLSAAIPLAWTASADPISAALADTACSYEQITAALNVASPMWAMQLGQRPDMQANLQQFLALPLDQRQQRIAEQQAVNPQLEALITAQIGPTLTQVANTCMNY
jgi:hemophore-related protein